MEGGGDMIADLAQCDNGEANARLIAAAPDMLEALRELDRILGHSYRHLTAIHAVRAAIAKAEGR